MFSHSESYKFRHLLSEIYKKASESVHECNEKLFASHTIEEAEEVKKQAKIGLCIMSSCDELMIAIMETTEK